MKCRPLLFLAIGALCLGGCTDQHIQENAKIVTYALWIRVLLFVLGAACLFLGWWGRKPDALGRGYALAFAFLGLMLLTMPFTMARNYVLVDTDHFEIHDGMPGLATEYNIRFADLHEIRLLTNQNRIGRTSSTTYTVQCVYRSGREEQMSHVGTLTRLSIDDILNQAAAAGVKVTKE